MTDPEKTAIFLGGKDIIVDAAVSSDDGERTRGSADMAIANEAVS